MGRGGARGDLDGVLADHATDIVMFDVPPPHDGVRGIDAYRATWPPFFDWQRQGALFELVELEVTAGDEYKLKTGERHRNTEFITLSHGKIVETQVFFGGRV